jgi:hypothetical protein
VRLAVGGLPRAGSLEEPVGFRPASERAFPFAGPTAPGHQGAVAVAAGGEDVAVAGSSGRAASSW